MKNTVPVRIKGTRADGYAGRGRADLVASVVAVDPLAPLVAFLGLD